MNNILLCLALCLLGCRRIEHKACKALAPAKPCFHPVPSEGKPLAHVGQEIITDKQLQQRLVQINAIGGKQVASLAQLEDLLRDEIRFVLLAQEAQRRGFAEHPAVIESARREMVRRLLDNDLPYTTQSHDTTPIDDAVIQAYYEHNHHLYVQPEMRKFAIMHPHQKQESFLDYEQAKLKYGDNFADSLFAINPTDTSHKKILSKNGTLSIQLTDYRSGITRPLAEVREQIREKLRNDERSKNFQTYLARVQQDYQITIEHHALENMLQREQP